MNTTRRSLIAAGAAAAVPAFAADAARTTDLFEAFSKRQSVRRYKPDPVPDEHLRQILDAARRAPTTMNQQPWKFLVVRDKSKIEAMRKRTMALLEQRGAAMPAAERAEKMAPAFKMTEGYFTASVYVVILVDKQCNYVDYALRHDGPLAAGYLMLAARALGYGTVYLTDGIPESVSREVLGLPDRYQRICMTPIGIPDLWPDPKPKKRLEELVAWESL